jgi:Zn-dependent protease
MPELDASTLALGAIWFAVFLFSTTLHEAAHAFVSWRLGDPTAYHGGQVSLNPLPHMRREPFGMVVVPLLTFLLQRWMVGWASAPYDPLWAHRHPRRAGLMALAGPAANLSVALVAGLALRIGLWAGAFAPSAREQLSLAQIVTTQGSGSLDGLATLLSVMFSLNLILFLFNLLPLPPMDGSAVLQIFLPDGAAQRYAQLVRQPMLAILGLLVAWRLFGFVMRPVFALALGILYG